jgi:hypothetical protein
MRVGPLHQKVLFGRLVGLDRIPIKHGVHRSFDTHVNGVFLQKFSDGAAFGTHGVLAQGLLVNDQEAAQAARFMAYSGERNAVDYLVRT